MKKIRKIINNIILVILIVVLICICYSRFIRKDEMVTVFGKGFLVIVTESMSPTIESGDFIIISEEDIYEEGDIVTYLDESNMIVTHRITKINDKSFIAKGDNNNIEDKEEDLNNIFGKVILKSSVIGFFVLYLLKPCLLIYIIYLVISEIIHLFKNKEVNENECEEDDDMEENLLEEDIIEEEECECEEEEN